MILAVRKAHVFSAGVHQDCKTGPGVILQQSRSRLSNAVRWSTYVTYPFISWNSVPWSMCTHLSCPTVTNNEARKRGLPHGSTNSGLLLQDPSSDVREWDSVNAWGKLYNEKHYLAGFTIDFPLPPASWVHSQARLLAKPSQENQASALKICWITGWRVAG